VADSDDFRVLDGTTQASHAMLGSRRKAADRAGKRAVHARAAGDGFEIPTLVKYFPEHIFGQLESVYVDEEAIRPGNDVGNRCSINVVPFVAFGKITHSFS
jgi:hypothetical protein